MNSTYQALYDVLAWSEEPLSIKVDILMQLANDLLKDKLDEMQSELT